MRTNKNQNRHHETSMMGVRKCKHCGRMTSTGIGRRCDHCGR